MRAALCADAETAARRAHVERRERARAQPARDLGAAARQRSSTRGSRARRATIPRTGRTSTTWRARAPIDRSAAPDIVETREEAERLELPPLIIRASLERYLAEHLPGVEREIELERIGEGHSNITYLVARGDERFVLRRPPRPPLPPSAHDVLREWRLLDAIKDAAVRTPHIEANGRARVGRFGWKAQHASLESFAADAYLNEMGITSPLLPDENSVDGQGRCRAPYDTTTDPEDDGEDLVRSPTSSARRWRRRAAPATAPVASGEQVFNRVGCATCHVASLGTAPAKTVINGGAMTVPAALGNKTNHPYSDFLLHDVGTGDGIPIQPTAEYAVTANKMQTAPLWGLRTRNRLMHDGLSFTLEESILRHGGQAASVTQAFQRLSAADKATLIAFLKSL